MIMQQVTLLALNLNSNTSTDVQSEALSKKLILMPTVLTHAHSECNCRQGLYPGSHATLSMTA